jgi:pimeloyl-ACP methyl ester carboxylesterase
LRCKKVEHKINAAIAKLKPMNKISALFYFSVLSVFMDGCNETPKIEYGSNGGKYLNILNTKIYYEEYGQGMPLLLLSGGGLTRSIGDFEKCIPDLAKHFRVIVPDSPGQGHSEVPDSLSYEILTEFMSQLIDSLNIDSTYVMGWSDGAITGLLLAEKRPDRVKKVIAVGANNGLRGAAIPAGIPLDSIKPFSIGEFEKLNKDMIGQYVKTLPRDWQKMFNDLNAMWYQREYFSDSVLTRIQAPVMIVLGDRDDISIAHGEEMHRLIAGSQLCVLPNTTHEVFAEKPDLINRIAIDFFEK